MTNPVILYNSLIPSATTITVTSEAAGFAKENAYDWLTFDYWKPSAAGTVYYTMDFGAAVAVDGWGWRRTTSASTAPASSCNTALPAPGREKR